MKNLFKITEEELHKELQRKWDNYNMAIYRNDKYGWLDDEYSNNPHINFDTYEREARHYYFRFLNCFGVKFIHWNFSDYGWGNITLDQLVENLMLIIKRDYQ